MVPTLISHTTENLLGMIWSVCVCVLRILILLFHGRGLFSLTFTQINSTWLDKRQIPLSEMIARLR